MLYIIYPNDPSTQFMRTIIHEVDDLIHRGHIKVIKCDANDESYANTINEIEAIPIHSKVIFIGHSTSEKLYGGMSNTYNRKSLIDLSKMSLFKSKELFLISCFSSRLLKSSRPHRESSKCIGFGLLPSELGEVTAHKQLNSMGLDYKEIALFRQVLSNIMAKSVNYLAINDVDLNQVFSFMKILFNKKISELILSGGNKKVAEILFYVVNEAVLD